MDLRSTFLSCIFDALFGDTPLDHIFSHMPICPNAHFGHIWPNMPIMGIWAYVKKYGAFCLSLVYISVNQQCQLVVPQKSVPETTVSSCLSLVTTERRADPTPEKFVTRGFHTVEQAFWPCVEININTSVNYWVGACELDPAADTMRSRTILGQLLAHSRSERTSECLHCYQHHLTYISVDDY